MATSVPDPCFIKIVNVVGAAIYRDKWIPADTFLRQINTSRFPEGTYLIEVHSDKYYQTGRLKIMR